MGFSSCKKSSSSTASQYITFDVDGATKSWSGEQSNLYTGSSSGSVETGGEFIDLNSDAIVAVSFPKDTVKGSDLLSLIGHTYPILESGSSAVYLNMEYTVGSDTYYMTSANNPIPANFFKVTDVTFYKEVTNADMIQVKQYIVTGEFAAHVTNGVDVKPVTNGKFKLIFEEAYD